ncbi:MAG: hypothetical protein H6742_07330 [Alphaproteobacteria bacterium]|nr:hypothetical protein [Alphaproteobacteria bacterium]
MNEREHDEITRFLTMVGKGSLFEYLELEDNASDGQVEQAIKTRRGWAQGQQANPKYRSEALWVIKNQRLLRAAMIEHRADYLSRVSDRDVERKLEVLALFVRGTLASGTLTPAGEQAIFDQGRNLELPETRIRALIDELAAESKLDENEAEPFVDHYEALEIPPTASAEQIENAYRKKYRWARTLSDTRRAQGIYGALDAALRDLRDPLRRAEYDAEYRRVKGGSPAEPGAAAYLPPPIDDPVSHFSAAPPPTHPSRSAPPRRDRREITEPPGTAPPVKATPPSLTPGAPPPRDVPRPPEQLVGRSTLGLDAPSEPNLAKLVLSTPAQVGVLVGKRPESVAIRLRQEGEGRVTARVLADRDWVTVEPGRIGADQVEVVIRATIHPERMNRSRGSSVVTIVPSQGPRISVTLDVDQQKSGPPIGLIVGGLALVVAAAGGGAAWYMNQEPPIPPGVIRVEPDPPTAIVWAGDRLLGEGAVDVPTELVEAGPVTLKVELDGFKDWKRTVEAPPGESVLVQPNLPLAEPLTFAPARGLEGTVLSDGAGGRTIARYPSLFSACAAPGTSVSVRVYVAFGGDVKGVEFVEPEDPPKEAVSCIVRGLSALTIPTPTVPTDYFYFDHIFEPPPQ